MFSLLPNRRKPSSVQLATLIALILQLAALAVAFWHSEREIESLEVRDAAIERIVEHVEAEIGTPEHSPLAVEPAK